MKDAIVITLSELPKVVFVGCPDVTVPDKIPLMCGFSNPGNLIVKGVLSFKVA